MIENKGLSDYVHLLGNHPNHEVLEMMSQHHIFLFTSDKNEGWGVVLNEAMGRVCCPVASHLIGAVPFLLKHKKNGMVYESEDINSLFRNVTYLMDKTDELKRMSVMAYKSVKEDWSPNVAAERMINFFKEFLNGNLEYSYKEGVLSIARPICEDY